MTKKNNGSFITIPESFSVLRTNLKRLFVDNQWKSMVITATNQGEGTTTVTRGLARSLHKNGEKVLLIDANFRDPSFNDYATNQQEGLSEFLLEPKDIEAYILHQDNEPDLFLAGTHLENPTEKLGSQAMVALLENLKNRYDYILFDTPPAGGVADALIIGSLADAVLLVIEEGVTDKHQMKKTISAIQQAGGNVIGAVMNNK